MGDGQTITIAFEISRDDYMRWAEMLRTKGPSAQQWRRYDRWREFLAAWALCLGLLCALAWLKKWQAVFGGGDVLLGVVLITLTLIAIMCGSYALRMARGGQARGRWSQESADSPAGRLWQGRKRVTAQPAMLVWEADHCTFLHRWRSVRSARVEGGFVLIDLGEQGAWPIPVAAFADQHAAAAFAALANHYRDAAALGPREDLRGALGGQG